MKTHQAVETGPIAPITPTPHRNLAHLNHQPSTGGRAQAPTFPLSHFPTFNPGPPYALRKDLGFWHLTFAGQHAILKHEQGLLYVAYLLLHPPQQPIHALDLCLKARSLAGQHFSPPDIIQQRALALDDAEAVLNLRRKQHQLEAILDDDLQIEAVKAEARAELQDIYQYQEQNPPRIRTPAQKAVRAVRIAIKRFHQHLVTALDAQGRPNLTTRRFAAQLERHLLVPSARYSAPGRHAARAAIAGCFTYEPPPGVTWKS